MTSTQDRLRGIALGAAIGDALGMPLEFQPRRDITAIEKEMVNGHLPAGTFTDDTEMALALAESLLAHTPLDGSDLALRFVDWYHGNPPDIGVHTKHVLSLIDTGTPWQEAANAAQQLNPGSSSNGSLMRCWPVAVTYWDQPELLISESKLQSEITHAHPDCVNSCVFINLLLQHLVNRNNRHSTASFLHASLSQVITTLNFDEDFNTLVTMASSKKREELPNSGWVKHTLESALWAVLTTNSFEDAVVQAVNLGSDADTTGSVAGALAGALYGVAAIPQRWTNLLRGCYPINSDRLWHASDLVQLADRLAHLNR